MRGENGAPRPAGGLEGCSAGCRDRDEDGPCIGGVADARGPAPGLELMDLGRHRRLAAAVGGCERRDAGRTALLDLGQQPGLGVGEGERGLLGREPVEARHDAQQVGAKSLLRCHGPKFYIGTLCISTRVPGASGWSAARDRRTGRNGARASWASPAHRWRGSALWAVPGPLRNAQAVRHVVRRLVIAGHGRCGRPGEVVVQHSPDRVALAQCDVRPGPRPIERLGPVGG